MTPTENDARSGGRPVEPSCRPADVTAPILQVSVGELLRWAALEVPDRTAIIDGAPDRDGRWWTYADLLAVSERTAGVLLEQFEPGERIAVWAANSPEWLILQLASALAGLVLTTLNPLYRDRELDYTLRRSAVVGLVHAGEHRGFNMAAAAARAGEEIPGLRTVLRLDDLLAWEPVTDALPQLSPVDPASIALVQFTSGTTGAPKGVLLHHRGIVNSARFVADRAGVEEGCVWVNPMPTFHIGSCGTVALGCISKLGTHVIVPGFEPGLVLDLIESLAATTVLAVPTMLLGMLEHPTLAQRDFSSLVTVLTGGSLAPAALVRTVKDTFGVRFTITFGQTETSGPSMQTHPDGSIWEQAETIGRPLPHTELKIIDPGTGSNAPVGEEGEICTRGPLTMAGYLHDGEKGGSGLTQDGWLHYGDVGSMDPDGYVRITGRLKDMIISGGENISPREIEDCLTLHPQVADAAIIGVPDPKWGEHVVAVVRAVDPRQPPGTAELDLHCRAHLAPFKVPFAWQFVDEFPLTPSGKIQKFVLRERFSSP